MRTETGGVPMNNCERLKDCGKSVVATMLGVALLSLVVSGCVGKNQQGEGFEGNDSARLVSVGEGICQDTKTGLMWQTEASRSIKSLEGAQNYTTSLTTGGYTDWRMPTVIELYDLYTTFDLHENGDCRMKVEGTYWSDEEDLEGRVGTWELDDNCDPERRYIPKQKGLVRAVRK